jgi:hypothetical protein
MESPSWIKEFPGAVVVCDTRGIILDLNDQAEELYRNEGGSRLLGTNVLDCHPEPSRSKLAGMLETPRLHVYTTEKKERHRLIYQTPWYQEGRYAGYIEMILDIPAELPHFIRD